MYDLNLRQLRIFVAVAESGNLAGAGRQLRLSRATLSETIRALEDYLGKPLFDRGNRRLNLNPAGRAFLRDAKDLLNHGEAIQRHHSQQSLLICGASVTVGNYILPPILLKLANDHPKLHIDLIIRNTESIAQMVLSREIQAAVVEGRVAHPDLVTVDWREDALVLIAPTGHRLIHGADPASLSRERWILRERGSGTRESFDAESSGWPSPPHVVITAWGNEVIKAAVAAGQGLGCLSGAAVRPELDRGELAILPYTSPRLLRTLTFICRRDALDDAGLRPLTAALALPDLATPRTA